MGSAFVPAPASRPRLTLGGQTSARVCSAQSPAWRPVAASVRRAAPASMCADGGGGGGDDVEEAVPLVGLSPQAVPAPAAGAEVDDRTESQKEIDRLRAAEKFIQVDEGKFSCPGCDYMYEPERGEFLNSVRAGTAFEDLPADFCCPVCKTPKKVFSPIRKTIAGFAENQQYGLGTNSLTAGQKNGLIFGGLAFFFMLLLSGYALN
jgi:rubredoxin